MVKMPKPFIDAIDRANERRDEIANRFVVKDDLVGTMLYEAATTIINNAGELGEHYLICSEDMAALRTAVRLVERKKALRQNSS